MRLLLDSHVVLWATGWPERLREATREAIASPENEVFVSAATLWELELKRANGTLTLPDHFADLLHDQEFAELPIHWRHAESAMQLPPIHADPFDRLLLAQARAEMLTFVTADALCLRYPVSVMEA